MISNIYHPSHEEIKKAKVVQIDKNGEKYYFKLEDYPKNIEDSKHLVIDYQICNKDIRDWVDKREKAEKRY